MRWLWIAIALLLLVGGSGEMGGADPPAQPAATAPRLHGPVVAPSVALSAGGSSYVVVEVPP